MDALTTGMDNQRRQRNEKPSGIRPHSNKALALPSRINANFQHCNPGIIFIFLQIGNNYSLMHDPLYRFGDIVWTLTVQTIGEP